MHFIFIPKSVAVLHCFLRSHSVLLKHSPAAPCWGVWISWWFFAIWEGLRKEPSVFQALRYAGCVFCRSVNLSAITLDRLSVSPDRELRLPFMTVNLLGHPHGGKGGTGSWTGHRGGVLGQERLKVTLENEFHPAEHWEVDGHHHCQDTVYLWHRGA